VDTVEDSEGLRRQGEHTGCGGRFIDKIKFRQKADRTASVNLKPTAWLKRELKFRNVWKEIHISSKHFLLSP